MNTSDTIHMMEAGSTVCDKHPGARTFTDGGVRVCLATVQEHGPNTGTSAAEAAKKKCERTEEETPIVFKTPQQILIEKEERLRREQAQHVRRCQDLLAMYIDRMVKNGKTECAVELGDPRLKIEDFVTIEKRLAEAGYTVKFVNKKTGISIFSNGAAAASTASGPSKCECSSVCGGGEIGGVIRELAYMKTALLAWASSVLVKEDGHKVRNAEIAVEARIFITPPPQSSTEQAKGRDGVLPFSVPGAYFYSPIHQDLPLPPPNKQSANGNEEGRGPVMQLLMTTPITHILLAFFILPMFLPRFLVGIWQLFMGFILVSRFLRYHSRPVPAHSGQPTEPIRRGCCSSQAGLSCYSGVYAAQGC